MTTDAAPAAAPTTQTATATAASSAAPASNDTPAAAPAADTPAAAAPTDGAIKDTPAGEPAKTDSPAEPNKDDAPAAAPADDKSKTDTPQGEDQASDGKKPDDQKDQEGSDKEGQTPQAQDYQQALSTNLPEGMEVDAEALEKATPFFQKYKVPAEAMAEVGPIVGGMISKAMKANSDAHQRLVDGWHDETVALHGKEGEEAFTKKNAIANRAIAKFFPEEQRNMMKHYGFGNMSGLFAMAYQVGLAMGEDDSSLPSAQGVAGSEDLAATWYPDAVNK